MALAGSVTDSGGRLRAECSVQGAVTRRTYLSKAYTATDADARRFAHQVADAIVLAVTGNPGMASGRLAMVGTRSGKKELYLSDSDGKGLVQLTQDKTVSVAPKWGPHNQIVYTSYLKSYPDVYLINIVSGNRQRISSYSGLNTGADLSPDGREVALVLSKDGNPELYVKNLGSSKLTRLTTTRQVAEASPSWSPDGRQIVYVSDSSGRPHVYIVSRSGGRPRRISSFGTENVAPDWGSQGRIAYCTRRDGRYQIAVFDPKSGQTEVIETGDGADYESPSWAPDGRHIACSRTQNYRSSVYILDTMGDGPIALFNHQGDWYSPSWSP
jgi:TolB protein